MARRDYILIIITAFIWGTNFTAIRWGLDEMPPLYFTGLRFLLVFFPAMLFIPRPKISWTKIILLGLFIGALQFSLLFLAMSLGLPAGLASLIMQSQVLFTLLLLATLFGERINVWQGLGIAVAFIGFAVLAFSGTPTLPSLTPLLIALLGAFTWACGNLVYKTAGNANRFHLTIWSAVIAPIPMFALSYIFESNAPFEILSNVTPKGWFSMMYNVVFSTIIAYGIWGTLLGKYPAIIVTPWALTIPIFGMASAAILLGERLTRQDAMASGLILFGLAICMLGPLIFTKRKAIK